MSTYTPIASITLASAQSSITFSNIPQTYTDLVLVASPIQTGNEDIRCQINDDTASNYSTTILTMNSSGGASSAIRTGQTAATVGFYQSGLNTSSGAPMIIQFQNYSNTTTNKTWLSRSGQGDRNSLDAMVSLWRNTSAITSIKFFNNNSTGTYDFLSGSTFNLYGIANASITNTAKATGGDSVTTDGTYWYHTFRSSGTFTPTQSLTADYLVVAGGGGAGSSGGGGGGAGGLRCTVTATGGGGSLESALSLTAQAYTVTVGAGGAGRNASIGQGSSGNNSVFSTITSTGGGGGGGGTANSTTGKGLTGGSGGGGSNDNTTTGAGGTGTANQGYAGGTGSTDLTTYTAGGGGGGASAQGGNASNTAGGNGGNGVATSITGSSVTYAGGGGGASQNGSQGSGGTGGGGTAATGGNNATANLGGGGGAGTGSSSGSGGSGIVIVRYAV